MSLLFIDSSSCDGRTLFDPPSADMEPGVPVPGGCGIAISTFTLSFESALFARMSSRQIHKRWFVNLTAGFKNTALRRSQSLRIRFSILSIDAELIWETLKQNRS